MSESHARLMATLHDELAALDSEDAARIEAATGAKLAALHAVRDSPPLSAADLEQAAALNALAAARTRTLMAGVDRRLRALSAAAGRPAGLTYGRDGRTSL
jgi:hypothetical protein